MGEIRQRSEVIDVLRRAGISPSVLQELERELPKEFDVDRYRGRFEQLGIDRGTLSEQMGSSP